MNLFPELIKCPECNKWSPLVSPRCRHCETVFTAELIQNRKDELSAEAKKGKDVFYALAGRFAGIMALVAILGVALNTVPGLLESPTQRVEREKKEQAEAKAKEKGEKDRIIAAEREANRWVPEGFTKLYNNQEMAFRYTKESCDKGEYCTKVEVVSKNNCSSIYGEVALHDNNNRNVGFTNDIAAGVASGQVTLLEFYTYEEGFSTWSITKLNCSQI